MGSLYTISFFISFNKMYVVYFKQRLGAAHPKCWLKQSFSAFFFAKKLKMQKSSKFGVKFCKKIVFLSQHPNTCRQTKNPNPDPNSKVKNGKKQFFQRKMTILTSVLGAQHPNTGQNIQQMSPLAVTVTKKILPCRIKIIV